MQITRDMIVGARILEVYRTFRTADDLDFCEHYFTCDKGFSFRLPQGGVAWETESVPSAAERQQDHVVRSSVAVRRGRLGQMDPIRKPDSQDDIIYRLKQPAVAQVLCGPYVPELGFYEPWDATLLMTDGFRLSCFGVAPHGTGQACLYYRPPDPELISRMTDYFCIPVEGAA